MGKLEDIPKKHIFHVPEGYFENLPSRIQSRMTARPQAYGLRPVFRYALQYAFLFLLLGVILFHHSRPDREGVLSILATVETDALVDFLHESGMTTEDILDHVDFHPAELEAIENEVYEFGIPQMREEELDVELNTL